MKKILLFFSLFFLILILSSCAKNPSATQNQNNQQNSNDDYQADQATICLDMCINKIPDLCQDEISDGNFSEESLFDEASCQLSCEADWDDATIGCVSEAIECAQIMDDSPYCVEIDTDDSQSTDINNDQGCPSACQKYKKCAGYGDDVTSADMEDAYNSCMEICGAWKEGTTKCINEQPINNPADCAHMSACALSGF